MRTTDSRPGGLRYVSFPTPQLPQPAQIGLRLRPRAFLFVRSADGAELAAFASILAGSRREETIENRAIDTRQHGQCAAARPLIQVHFDAVVVARDGGIPEMALR